MTRTAIVFESLHNHFGATRDAGRIQVSGFGHFCSNWVNSLCRTSRTCAICSKCATTTMNRLFAGRLFSTETRRQACGSKARQARPNTPSVGCTITRPARKCRRAADSFTVDTSDLLAQLCVLFQDGVTVRITLKSQFGGKVSIEYRQHLRRQIARVLGPCFTNRNARNGYTARHLNCG